MNISIPSSRLKSVVESNVLTTFLSIFIVSMLLFLIFTKTAHSEQNIPNTETTVPDENSFWLSSDLLPDGFDNSLAKKILINENAAAKVIISDKIPKQVPSPTPLKVKYSEVVSSTAEKRDEDRSLITKLLSDRMSEYSYMHGKIPQLYSNKSKIELTENLSKSIYLYNGDSNRTNAAAIILDTDGYLFSKVNNCDLVKSKDNTLVFSFVGSEISLCLESGLIKKFDVNN